MSRLRRQILAVALLLSGGFASAPAAAGELTLSDVDTSELMTLLMIGQPEQVVREATRMADGLRPTDDPDSVHLIGEILTFRCKAHNDLGQYVEARASCLEAIAIFEAAEKDDRPGKWHTEDFHIAQALSHLATTYAETGDLEGALEVRLKELQRDAGGSAEKVRRLVQVGELQMSLGRFREAEASYVGAIAAQAEIRRDERNMQPIPYVNLAILYQLEERFGRAEEVLMEGIADVEQTQAVLAERNAKFGLHSHELKSIAFYLHFHSQTIGWVYFHQGRFDEAKETARDVLAYYEAERMFGIDMITDVKILLGRIEDAEHPGSPAARSYLQSAVELQGSSDFMRAIAQYEFARHHLLADNDAAAEPYSRVAVATLAWIEGEVSLHTARARVTLARVFQFQAKYDEALAPAQAAFAAQWLHLPPYHSEVGETLALMAELYAAVGNEKNLSATKSLIERHKAARVAFENGK